MVSTLRSRLVKVHALLLYLDSAAVPVGGVGVANTMVASVLERHSEIGLCRPRGFSPTEPLGTLPKGNGC